jgi:hypothetical protein
VIGVAATGHAALERRMRQRRAAKIVLAVVFAVVWVPFALVMLVAGTSGRRA